MLNAIIFGKKYGSRLAGINLKEEFSGSEDILTATIFERLFYLDDQRTIRILTFAVNRRVQQIMQRAELHSIAA